MQIEQEELGGLCCVARGVARALNDFKNGQLPPPIPGLSCKKSHDWSKFLSDGLPTSPAYEYDGPHVKTYLRGCANQGVFTYSHLYYYYTSIDMIMIRNARIITNVGTGR